MISLCLCLQEAFLFQRAFVCFLGSHVHITTLLKFSSFSSLSLQMSTHDTIIGVLYLQLNLILFLSF